jgi:hypothetical protein
MFNCDFDFLKFKVLGRFIQKLILFLSKNIFSYWLVHCYFSKKFAKLERKAILQKLLVDPKTSSKHKMYDLLFFGEQFVGQKDSLRTYKPLFKIFLDKINFCIKRLKTLNSF